LTAPACCACCCPGRRCFPLGASPPRLPARALRPGTMRTCRPIAAPHLIAALHRCLARPARGPWSVFLNFGGCAPAHSAFAALSPEQINPKIKDMEYAVRGQLVINAMVRLLLRLLPASWQALTAPPSVPRSFSPRCSPIAWRALRATTGPHEGTKQRRGAPLRERRALQHRQPAVRGPEAADVPAPGALPGSAP
jgi:hypothetical protein